jgi:hypothetical protein
MIEKQVIVQWYTPEEKMPEQYEMVPATISGVNKQGNLKWDNALVMASWDSQCGWMIDGYELEEFAELTVHAWCDLRPYGG